MTTKVFVNQDFQSAVKPINLPAPTSAGDAAPKSYVDSAAAGAFFKQEVQWATTAALPANTYNNGTGTITANANGALSVDGNAPALNDSVLVKNEATGANDGIYVVTNTGSGVAAFVLTRRSDANAGAELNGGATVFVKGGTANGNTTWTQNVATVTIGTTAQTWVQSASQTAGLSNPVTVAQGGTGQTTAGAARGTSGIGAPTTAPGGTATAAGIPTKVTQQLTAPTSAGSPYSIVHNLGTQDVVVGVRDATTNAQIGVSVVSSDTNTVQITFDTNESNNVVVTVIG